jgi:hypothetical protein
VIVAYSGPDAIARLAATGANGVQRHNPGRDEAVMMTIAVVIPGVTARAAIRRHYPCGSDEDPASLG